MGLSSRYTIRKEATPALLDLLTQTTLGTNGARYRHMDTRTRIHEADNPTYISLERDGKVQGNITLCNRGKRMYVRYFAFANQKQASRNVNKYAKRNSRLKLEMASFFDDILDGKMDFPEVPEALYAYIDPANERSKWMAEQFGFRTEAQLISQSFSRTKPKSHERVSIIDNQELIDACLEKIKEKHAYYIEQHAKRGPFYAKFDENGEVVAFAKITKANWVIERLPGMLGGLFTKLIKFTPGIRRIVKPDNHQFLVPESVWVKDNNPKDLSDLLEGILAAEQVNMMIWFVDRRENLWRESRHMIDWGLFHKMTPQPIVDVVVLRKNPLKMDELRNKPIFVAGWDMV